MGFHTCGPNAALVKSGAFVTKPIIVSGGFVYALPCVQQVQTLDLRVMTLDINSPHVYTKQGVPITVRSIAQVKISRYARARTHAHTHTHTHTHTRTHKAHASPRRRTPRPARAACRARSRSRRASSWAWRGSR